VCSCAEQSGISISPDGTNKFQEQFSTLAVPGFCRYMTVNATDERVFEFLLLLFLANSLGKTCARTTDVEKALIDGENQHGC
jgi:hypothetical protein